jgi:hypothetical protein
VVVGDPRDDVYFQTWEKIQRRRKRRIPAKGETAEILNAVFEKGTKVDPTLVDLWKEASRQRDEFAKPG